MPIFIIYLKKYLVANKFNTAYIRFIPPLFSCQLKHVNKKHQVLIFFQ